MGVVARAAPKGKIILAYLFGPQRTDVPTLGQVEGLKAEGAVLRIMVGDLGLIRGEWPLIGESKSWQRAEWPMPLFIRREPLGCGRAWLVHYADDDPSRRLAEEPISPQSTGLGRESLFGAGAAEAILSKVLTETQRPSS